MSRLSQYLNKNTLFWLVPLAVCCAIHWAGFQSYFWADDFAWLSQKQLLTEGHTLWELLFTPTPHGTWRPWTDHLFFIVLTKIYGFDPVPFRIVVFATQLGSVALLASIVRRLSGSAIAGMLAPILWMLNGGTSVSMVWTSSYTHILCGFSILLAFRLLLAYDETNRPYYYWLQVLVFVLGLGAMETAVLYPALAVLWASFLARHRLKTILPLLGVSAVFLILHARLVPKNATGYYALHFDASILPTFLEYCRMALLPTIVEGPHRWLILLAQISVWTSAIGLGGFLAFSAWRKHFLPIMFLGWFAILLAPVLPLRDHISDYYLTLPTLAFGALGACAIRKGLGAGRSIAALTVLLAAPYVLASAFFTPRYSRYLRNLTWNIEDFTTAAAELHAANPGKTVVLDNVPDELLTGCVYEGCLRALGIQDVFPAAPASYPAGKSEFFINASELQAGLSSGSIVLYEKSKDVWKPASKATAERYRSGRLTATVIGIDFGRDQPQSLLVGDWGSRGPEIRWTGRNVGVKLAGPTSASQKLEISGYCLPDVPEAPRRQKLAVSADGNSIGQAVVEGCKEAWRFTFALPARLLHKPEILVEMNIDPVFWSPHEKAFLGLPVTKIQLVE